MPDTRRHSQRQPRLPDRVGPALRILFVGINPGLRSASLGHHFAGHSNRFWRLLADAGLVPGSLTFEDDERLPALGLGVTNLVARPTAGVADLAPAELRAGRRALLAKVRRLQPRRVALVGVTVYRALFPDTARVPARAVVGEVPETLAGAPVFVLPNPSGRNAHYSYADMLAAYRQLAALPLRSRSKMYPTATVPSSGASRSAK
jgi:TDG/mug DNA glycosylase family protein